MEVVLIINGSFNQIAKSVEDALNKARIMYKDICYQEHCDVIEVRELITEQNGYKHEGTKILTKCESKIFWINNK